MFVHIGKIFLPLVQPLGLSAVLWLAGALAWWRRRNRCAVALVLCGNASLLLFSCLPVSNALLGRLEDDYPLMAPAAAPCAGAIVVLGGVTAPQVAPRLDVDVLDGFDRLLHGMRLWRAGKAPVLVLSGGVMAQLEGSEVTEAARLRRLALEYGLPAAALLLEERSRTTRENAVYVAELLERLGVRRILLVTSASHMRRAMGVFRAAGVDAIPAPTDVRVAPKPFHAGTLLPSLDALDNSTRALKEYVGCWVYWSRGWIR